MQPRLGILRRLVALYSTVEETHSTELQRMTAAFREVQHAIVMEQDVTRAARADCRSALIAGDQMSSMAAEVQQDASAWRRRGLEQIRVKREELNDAAKTQYLASRLKKEQIKRVFDDIAARVELEERRRMQAISDDRFLARRRWTDTREKTQDAER